MKRNRYQVMRTELYEDAEGKPSGLRFKRVLWPYRWTRLWVYKSYEMPDKSLIDWRGRMRLEHNHPESREYLPYVEAELVRRGVQ